LNFILIPPKNLLSCVDKKSFLCYHKKTKVSVSILTQTFISVKGFTAFCKKKEAHQTMSLERKAPVASPTKSAAAGTGELYCYNPSIERQPRSHYTRQ